RAAHLDRRSHDFLDGARVRPQTCTRRESHRGSDRTHKESRVMEAQLIAPTRPVYWSIRREVWENRSLWVAPGIVAAVMQFGFLISTMTLRHGISAAVPLDQAEQRAAIEMPLDMTAGLLMLTAFIVGVFYCLDALHGERRDRSILFWKSLPVSDRTTVLSKATIPLVVLPLVTFAIVVAAQLVMLLWTSALLITHGMSPAST